MFHLSAPFALVKPKDKCSLFEKARFKIADEK